MSMKREKWDLDVCVDCLMVLANGEYPEDAERAAEVRDGCEHWLSLGYVLVVGDEERGFSWVPCGVCESLLGGDRHEAAALRVVEVK